jgi:hypothetical protein
MKPKIIARVVNDTGLAFNVRLVQKDDRYGLDDCLVHDQDEPLVDPPLVDPQHFMHYLAAVKAPG